MEWNKDFGFGVAAGIVATLVLLGIAVVSVAYTGMYNIAATEDHASFVRWAFETTFRNSVERRAERVTPPEVTADMIEAGASKYRKTCEHCHGGPGVEQTDWAHGRRTKAAALGRGRSRVEHRRGVLAGEARRQNDRYAGLWSYPR